MHKEELKTIIAGLIEKSEDEITDETSLSELGFDSINYINFIVAVEEKYNIEVLDSDLLAENFMTLDRIYQTLTKYFAASTLYKCLITDCDGVLWRGIAGESGIDKAVFDESALNYCNVLHKLCQKGVLLAVSSKNDYENIKSMLETDETLLNIGDFAIIDFNVVNKADSLAYIIKEFGILPDNVVYVDDSDYEIGFVESILSDVEAIKFDGTTVTKLEELFKDFPEQSDIDRTKQFREQKEREKVRVHTDSAQEYNKTLDTVIICEKAAADDLPRLSELSQRTNRFNITGQRYSEDELRSLMTDENYFLYVLKAKDRYGDMGLVAAAVVRGTVIENFMLSCRVFGRDFEIVLLDKIKQSIDGICGLYKSTGKNDYCRNFYKDNGVEYELL